MSAQKQFRWSVLLIWNLKVLFPVCTKIGERTEAFNQSVIPGLKLVQDITVLKEVNATSCLGLPDFDGLVIEGRTPSHWQVGMKQEMEEIAVWLWDRGERGELKETLESFVGRVYLQGMRDNHRRVGQRSHEVVGLL